MISHSHSQQYRPIELSPVKPVSPRNNVHHQESAHSNADTKQDLPTQAQAATAPTGVLVSTESTFNFSSASRNSSTQTKQSAQLTVEYQAKFSLDTHVIRQQDASPSTVTLSVQAPLYTNQNFSPDAVAERIADTVEARIQAERENGASEEELHSLYEQASAGVEQGLREAKKIISATGFFEGEVKDTYIETALAIDDALSALETSLFRSNEAHEVRAPMEPLSQASDNTKNSPEAQQKSITEPRVVTTSATNTQVTNAQKSLEVDRAFSALDESRARSASQSSALFFRQENTLEMEVLTQDGDRVTISIAAGEAFDYSATSRHRPGQALATANLLQGNHHDLNFSVDGELDNAELEALTELFSQVNEIAHSFYAGDTGLAFEHALSMGYDASELASFTINMAQTAVSSVTETYRSVQALDQFAKENPLQNIMDQLSAFSAEVIAAQERLLEIPYAPQNYHSLFADMLSQLLPVEETSTDIGNGFRAFVAGLLSDA